MARNHVSLNRGKGMKRNQRERPTCTNCEKRGMGPWRAFATPEIHGLHRDCRYCGRVEVQEAPTYATRVSHPGRSA